MNKKEQTRKIYRNKTDGQTDGQIGKQKTNRQADMQTEGGTERQTDRMTATLKQLQHSVLIYEEVDLCIP